MEGSILTSSTTSFSSTFCTGWGGDFCSTFSTVDTVDNVSTVVVDGSEDNCTTAGEAGEEGGEDNSSQLLTSMRGVPWNFSENSGGKRLENLPVLRESSPALPSWDEARVMRHSFSPPFFRQYSEKIQKYFSQNFLHIKNYFSLNDYKVPLQPKITYHFSQKTSRNCSLWHSWQTTMICPVVSHLQQMFHWNLRRFPYRSWPKS